MYPCPGGFIVGQLQNPLSFFRTGGVLWSYDPPDGVK
jgi:hypothetical protein